MAEPLIPSAFTVEPAVALAGRVTLPPDKSIAHRAAILSALAEGETQIVGYPAAADPQSTLTVLRALGVEIEGRDDSLFVQGVGLRGFHAPEGPLDCGNSGTTMRLMAGVLAGQGFPSTLVGDASLSRRPMDRIAEPLRQMGAALTLTDGHAPVRIDGRPLRGIEYRLPVASAQVKSCVLLAGLLAKGPTTVIETTPSRDHTERMLGLPVFSLGAERHISAEGGAPVPWGLRVVPRDFSAAAFFLVAGSVVPTATLELLQVGLNPSRTALLDVLRAMGARIEVQNERERGSEPIGDLRVHAPEGLVGVEVGGALIPNLIDEIPVLAVAAACAGGTTTIRDAAELRYKETDRLAATAAFLQAMGASVEETPDGLVIEGGHPLRGATIESRGDHRIAMAAAVASLTASGATTIEGADAVAVSFPGFWDELDALAGGGLVGNTAFRSRNGT
ncbi:MAG: 3-phosphoshikimate 1-carboxyvinyltransferase [Rhodothermaceae bacterium]|nr:3-phosphoshikimate 1-carboxyvinyltransferase [Rhodothermaceae bacterium]